MNPDLPRGSDDRTIHDRAKALFQEQLAANRDSVDRLFAVLLLFEWAASVLEAIVLSPLTSAGSSSSTHVHVWTAWILGGLTVGPPVALAFVRPGETLTRHCVAAAQMMMAALLIHLSGGRIEVHFHIFGSLAFLALYRDGRVLVTAGLIVAVDHYVRGVFWPMSVFGVPVQSPFRWLEHTLWVVFEGSFLAIGIQNSLRWRAESARAQAEVEATRDRVEHAVEERTAELARANLDLLAEVAERRKAEEMALRARVEAEEATRAKSEFLANMSHEIRTPMNAIIGMTELTLGLELAPEPRENLDVVRVSAESLLGLIDDILDLSKIEAGKLDLEPVPFRPREALDLSLRTLAHRASAKGLELAGSVDPDVPESVVGDPLRLRQVLLNLIGNAVKFTHEGRVEVRVGVDSDGSDGADAGDGSRTLRFAVDDDGIGIPESRRSTIFEPFQQADGSTTRKYGGTGLGLSISARLVALMGGRIWVESRPGQGSTFHFTARFAEPLVQADGRGTEPGPERVRAAGRTATGRRLRVLLVDDHEINRMVGTKIVRKLGHEVEAAVDGPDALARYESAGPFDLVLMDVQMPGMDGFEATARLREIQARDGRRVPVVALTAHAMHSDRQRCLAAGMDEHLPKPIRVEELDRLIRTLIPDLGTESEAEPDRPDPGAPAEWCLDPAEIRSALPLGDTELAQIVGRFRETCVDRVARIRGAIHQGDPRELARSARSLAGCLGMFASEATVGLVSEIESAGLAGQVDSAGRTLARLEGAIAGMQPTLDHLAGQPG